MYMTAIHNKGHYWEHGETDARNVISAVAATAADDDGWGHL